MKMKDFVEAFALHGAQPAIICGDRVSSYAALLQSVRRIWERLRASGVMPGEVVLLVSDYTPDGIATFLALYQNANIIAIDATGSGIERQAKVEAAQAAVVVDAHANLIVRVPNVSRTPRQLVERLVAASRAGLILFSSGSTSKPKSMLHDLDRLIDSYTGRRPKSVAMLLFLLFDHIGGINTLFNVLAMGGTAVIPVLRTPDEAGALIERHRISVLPTSPTFLNLMMMNGVFETYDVRSLRMITYGTEPMPEGLLLRVRAALPKVRLLQTFGTSETGIVNTLSQSSESLFMKFNDDGVSAKVIDGELWLKSDRRMLGYLDHESNELDEDGWFQTGDLVEEQDGFLKIKGRRKEIINVGGEKVFPAEVESVLMSMPGIRDCKVRREDNLVTGQFVVADIVLAEGQTRSPRTVVKEVRTFALARMESYKVPVRVRIVDEIPYSARFKKELRLPSSIAAE